MQLSAPGVDDSVLTSLMTIGRFMRQRLTDDGVDAGTWWLLHNLHCSGSTRLSDLAARINLDLSTVSRHVQQLAKSGLVERSRDPNDGRAQQVELTAAGRELLKEGFVKRRSALQERFADWSQNDIAELDRLLAKFVEGIENSTPELEQND